MPSSPWARLVHSLSESCRARVKTCSQCFLAVGALISMSVQPFAARPHNFRRESPSTAEVRSSRSLS